MILIATGNFSRILQYDSQLIVKEVSDMKSFVSELKALECIRHPNIIQVVSFQENQIMFKKYDTDLFHYIQEGKLKDRRHICLQIISAINAIHSAGFFHRDIKSDNVFINRQNEELVLGDFGMAAKYIEGYNYTLYSRLGFNQAPEIICGDPQYTPSIDIYAFGILFFELVNGVLPFACFPTHYSQSEMLNGLYDGLMKLRCVTLAKRYKTWRMTEDNLKFWKVCVDKNPKLRLSSKQDLANITLYHTL